MSNDTALLVVDVQTGFIEGETSVYQARAMLERIGQLIARARAAHVPVIYVRHDEAPEMDGPIHPAIAPQPGEPVIPKLTPDAFHQTTLAQTLRDRGIHRMILAGFQTEYCIDTTCRRACSMGYGVTLVQDAHSTYDGAALTAPQIIAHHTAVLAGLATVTAADEIVFGPTTG